jgi:hypothetical protein
LIPISIIDRDEQPTIAVLAGCARADHLSSHEPVSAAGSVDLGIVRRPRGLIARLASALLWRWRDRKPGSPPESDYLRFDMGLPPLKAPRKPWGCR